jgi:hypothetical protein
MTKTPMTSRARTKRWIRQLARVVRDSRRSKQATGKPILGGPVRSLIGRLISATVPKNASGNNASVR